MMTPLFYRRWRARPIIARADAARDQRSWEAAAVLYREALGFTPDRAGIWIQYGHALKEMGNRVEAGDAYGRAIALEPNAADTHLQIGHLRKLQGDTDAAAASYARALDLDRGLKDAAIELTLLGRGADAERIIAQPRSKSHQQSRGEPDRFGELEARMGVVSSQITTFLEHVSTTKALAFELARLKAVVSEQLQVPDIAGRLPRLEMRLPELEEQIKATNAQIGKLFEHALSTSALSTEIARLAASSTEAAHRSADLERDLAAVTDSQQRTSDELNLANARMGAIASEMPKPEDVARLREGVDRITNDLRGRGQHLEALQSWVEQYARETADTLHNMQGRTEFVRRELMYEYRYNKRDEAFGAKLIAEPKVLNAERLEAAQRQGRIVLNVGCGHIPHADCLNVDRRALPSVDIVAEADALPFEPGAVSEIRSSHLIEHYPQEALERDLLPHWRSILKPGGRLKAVVPDGETMLAEHAAGRFSYEDLREVMYGAQDYEGDFHYNMFTPDSLEALLRRAGFLGVNLIEKGRRNGKCYEFEIEALNP